MPKITHKVFFYADTDLFTNKLFSWRVQSLKDAVTCCKRFQKKGWNIRAAWYAKIINGYQFNRQRLTEIQPEKSVSLKGFHHA